MSVPVSAGLRFTRLTEADITRFHGLATDDHVRAWLLDGELLPLAWAQQEVARSQALFDERDVGLWLIHEAGELIGFCGFRVFEMFSLAPQLLYALLPAFTGRGIASAVCRALLDYVHARGWQRVEAAVDAPNHASLRVLEKNGFVSCGHAPGVFGDTLLLEHLWEVPVRIDAPVGTRHALTIASTWDGEPALVREHVAITLEHRIDELIVAVDAPFHGDPAPPTAKGSTDALWHHEVVELMLLGENDRYLELELSPHGHYLVLLLEGARHVVHLGLPIHFSAQRDGERWRGRARVPLAWIPSGCRRLNAYAMHGIGAARRHLAWRPRATIEAGARPDFHVLAAFGSFTDLSQGMLPGLVQDE